ncbi:MAG: (2,3-dihydroxybenzoyl)adenylate synthase [SAR92 clade bacterium]|uniref:(2,3-dihydroxybenzoyl)adenylate synthase n=1 Tax=SAR92 clade bacterium TaxID=2315479 RepID=A0A520MIF3_9GAMM|nr:MAG: (2,3-dihydroxybenzoyl)adenylate synthase [SAR92 clade bacterium]
MITSPKQRISDYRERGWWGDDTLHGLLASNAKQYPDTLAVADQPNRLDLTGDEPCRLSFTELDVASDQLACQLLDRGISTGDRVIVQLPNIVELVVCYMAFSKIGAIISPVPVQYGSHELEHISATISPVAIVTLNRFGALELAKTAESITNGSVQLLVFGTDLNITSTLDPEKCLQVRNHQERYSTGADHILTISWTSGTTGTPKGVPRSHNMWVATARCCAEAGNYKQGDRFLNIFPLVNMASIGGFLYPALLLGCSIILHHPLDPGLYLTQLQNEKITFTIAPPMLLNQLSKSQDMWNQFDFSHLRSIGSGSAPLAPWMIETFRQQYGLEVINFYGSNEGISLFCTPMHTADSEVRATMFPRLGCGITRFDSYANRAILSKVVDTETGEMITESGHVGELLFAGATVFDGYLGTNNDELFSDDDYFHTGDLVELCGDPPAFYRIAGRCKDIINRGGMKISPAEIDILLEGLPGASEVAVCAYQDDVQGEKVCACLVVEPDTDRPSLDDVIDYLLKQGLAKFKLPERIEFLDNLPRNPLGKVQRFILEDTISQRDQEGN